MIYVIATATIKKESRDAFIAGAKNVIAETLKEKGCISYDLCASTTDPEKLCFVERWETLEDLAAHGKAPHMGPWRELSANMKISPTVIEVISNATVEVR